MKIANITVYRLMLKQLAIILEAYSFYEYTNFMTSQNSDHAHWVQGDATSTCSFSEQRDWLGIKA